jgi:hypothetical protein
VISLRAVRRAYERSEQAREDRRARARAYRLAKKTVTDQGSKQPVERHNLPQSLQLKVRATRKSKVRSHDSGANDLLGKRKFIACCHFCGVAGNRLRLGFPHRRAEPP